MSWKIIKCSGNQENVYLNKRNARASRALRWAPEPGQSGICLICIAEANMIYIPWDHPWCYTLPTSWWTVLWDSDLRWLPNIPTYWHSPQDLAYSQTPRIYAAVLCVTTVPCQLALFFWKRLSLHSLISKCQYIVNQGSYTGLNYRNKWINIPIFSYFSIKNSYFFPIFWEKNSYFPIFWTIPITWQPGFGINYTVPN